MLTAWANNLALVAFGLTIGVLAHVQQMLTPLAVRAAMNRDRRPGEGYFDSVRNKVDEQNELLNEARRRSPALRYTSWAVLALIAVLILMIALSPIELGWWWLIGSLFTGGLLAAGASRLARAGRVGVVSSRGFRHLTGTAATGELREPPGSA